MEIKKFCLANLHELAEHKCNDKGTLYFDYVSERLTKSFDTYQRELQLSIDYLNRRNELNVAKKMRRLG